MNTIQEKGLNRPSLYSPKSLEIVIKKSFFIILIGSQYFLDALCSLTPQWNDVTWELYFYTLLASSTRVSGVPFNLNGYAKKTARIFVHYYFQHKLENANILQFVTNSSS